jgi:hypothetical protein
MKSKSILMSVFTSLSDEEIKNKIEKFLTNIDFDIDRVLISNSTYINDIDTNNKFNCLLTCNVPDMTLHELSFITASLKENEIKL